MAPGESGDVCGSSAVRKRLVKKNRRLIAKINRLFENSKHRARLQMHAEERISRPVALSFQ